MTEQIDDNIKNYLFDPNIVEFFDRSLNKFLSHTSVSKYTQESLKAISNLLLHIDQHIEDANSDLINLKFLCVNTNLRSILDALVNLYYIFSDSDSWYLRARSYYFSKFQGVQRSFQSRYAFEGYDILDVDLKHLNDDRQAFFDSFGGNSLPDYVKCYKLTKNNWMYFKDIDNHGNRDWLIKYPWNNDSGWNIKSKGNYSVRQFMKDLGLESYYVYLYIPLSQSIHSSSETVSGIFEKLDENVFYYTPIMFFDPGFTQSLMLLLIKVVELLVNCVDSDMLSMRQDLSDEVNWEYIYFGNKYSLSELNDKLFVNKNKRGD